MIARPRLITHVSVLLAIAIPVFGSHIGTAAHPQSLGLIKDRTGYGSVLDASAAATVAAHVATTSGLLVSHEAATTADKLNAQIALPTSDESYLTKRQVVQTAGNATRGIQNYTIQNGDTLSAIASKYGVTTSTILWANNMSEDDMLKPGQALTILPVSGLVYTAKEGDNPDSLASKYQANAAQIISYNNLEAEGVKVGAKIIIPDGVMPAAPKPVVPVQAQVATSTRAASASYAPAVHYGGGSLGNSYAYGYCTWYVASRRAVPSFWGNANQWLYNARAVGYSTGSVPVPGAIAWSGAGYYGHVAYVESVNGGTVTISEMNYNGNWGRVTSRTVSAGSFLYVY